MTTTVDSVYRFLASRRWLVRTLAGIALVLVCIRLGLWQLDRSEERTARNAVIEANSDLPPASIDELTEPGGDLNSDDQWRSALITGRYDADHELILRLRPVDGIPGVHALTPLVTASGDAVLIDRGFVASEGRRDDLVDLPDPPSGPVTVQARMRASENGDGVDASTGRVRAVDLDAIDSTLPYQLYGAWGELTEQNPPATTSGAELRPIPAPEVESGPHLSYAIQWFLFATVGVCGFVLLVRAEARGREEGEDGTPNAATGRHEHTGAGRQVT